MIKSLKIRITAIFSALSILVLAIVIVLTYINAKNQIQNSANELFITQINNVSNNMVMSGMIKAEQVNEFIVSKNIYLYVEDNYTPLNFSEDFPKPFIEHAKAMAKNYGVNIETPMSSTRLDTDFITAVYEPHDTRVLVKQILGKNNEWVFLIAFQDRTDEIKNINSLTMLYILITTFSAFAMIIISWLLAGIAIKPTQETIKAQKDFIAAASHEIRSPLAVIRSSLSAMTVKPDEQLHFSKVIKNEVDHLARLTGDLFLLVDNDTASWTLKKQIIDVDTLCINLYESFLPIAEENNHKLILDLPENIFPHILADEARLIQLFSILLNNAIAHTNAGTVVKIKGFFDAKVVKISVSDNGGGIPAGEEKKIFEKFYQINKSRSDKNHLGLGLSIAKEIALLHNGQLKYKQTIGGGCTFTLVLPTA